MNTQPEKPTPEAPQPPQTEEVEVTKGTRLRQFAWMVGIWSMSVIGLGVFAYVLKLIMSAVGLHT